MNTDDNSTAAEANPSNQPAPDTVSSGDGGGEAPVLAQAETAAPSSDADAQPAAAPKQLEAASDEQPAAPPKPREAAADEQPGDDIGNRLPGSALPDDIGNRRAGALPAPGGESPSKKRRRRRRKKHATEGAPHDASAEGAAGEADGDAEGEGDAEGDEHAEGEHAAEGDAPAGEAGEGKRKRRGRGAPPSLRERPAFSIGEEVFGRVEKLTESAVWIDIAGKATGLFDRRELLDDEPPVEGDQFIATVASTGVRGGMLMLSRLPLVIEEARKLLEAAHEKSEVVSGFVTGAVKGGLEVDIGGLRAFAPASHVDLRHGADLNYLVGERLDFIVTQYAKKGRDIVVSRRKFLEEENRKTRAEAMAKIEPGSVQRAIVRKVVAWGVFMALPDVGGIEGLVHMTEASHDRGARLADLFKPGAELEVKVMRVDEKGKLWLSRKAATADPWEAVKQKYAVGTRHKGKIARLQPFGAFIELESGVDGLIHTADLSLKPIQHPSDVVKVGDEIEVVVASCDANAHKIGLHPAPPEGEESEPRQRIQPHKPVKVVVAQITEGGLVVRVLGVTGRSSRAFIPAGHTGTQRGTDLRKHFPIGTQLEAKVLEIDPRRGEAKLSIRALKEDAEKQAFQQYRAGVARDSKFGTFADLMKKTN